MACFCLRAESHAIRMRARIPKEGFERKTNFRQASEDIDGPRCSERRCPKEERRSFLSLFDQTGQNRRTMLAQFHFGRAKDHSCGSKDGQHEKDIIPLAFRKRIHGGGERREFPALGLRNQFLCGQGISLKGCFHHGKQARVPSGRANFRSESRRESVCPLAIDGDVVVVHHPSHPEAVVLVPLARRPSLSCRRSPSPCSSG